MATHNYFVIVGSGRSGSNRLLDMFDLSPRTLARNEADQVDGSPFSTLPRGNLPLPDSDQFVDDWQNAIDSSVLCQSVRDRIAEHPKVYIKEPLRKLIGRQFFRRNRVRSAIGSVFSIGGDEWRLPGWYLNKACVDQIVNVYKLNSCASWMRALFDANVPAKIIHNLREPHQFMASWYHRYFESQESDRVARENKVILTAAAQRDSFWADRCGDIASMSTIESQVMLWTYINESIHLAGRGKPNYRTVTYQQIDDASMQVSKDLYAFVGLEWTEDIGERVARMDNKLFKKRSELSSDAEREVDDALAKYLPQSALAQLF
ncbi:MAG: sulfotransferase domain-containing protein [Planctomycetales bacterium]|nr:sulfotransferase domain-containing protein [Planctomycetales bacterium]